MDLRDMRYLAAYLTPIFCIAGLYYGKWLAPGTLYFGFILIPLIELFVPASPNSDDEEILKKKSEKSFFDILLYVNVPIVYGVVFYFSWLLAHRDWTTREMIFSILNVGIFLGVSGINVAHELGHRSGSFDKWMARLLLVPALYSHFTLEHNYGHHLKVGTQEDPATARKNESIYAFYFRSIGLSYMNAWKIANRMIAKEGLPKWKHEIIIGHLGQVILLLFVYSVASMNGLLAYLCTAFVGILVLESVNYIEHYGLVRRKLVSGRYEPMTAAHSWNSNHELGRIVLFELVRHSDHHYQTTRKYQTLRDHDESPQLPFGYPMSIIMALVPPLWFWIMNRKLADLEKYD